MKLTELHMRIILALMYVAEQIYTLRFLHTFRQTPDGRYLFGFTEEDPAAPFVEARLSGDGPGDYYSGSIEYDDEFRIRNVFDEKQRPVSLYYNHVSTSLAGDCSTLTSNYFTETEMPSIETLFFDKLNSKEAIPAEWSGLYEKDSRTMNL